MGLYAAIVFVYMYGPHHITVLPAPPNHTFVPRHLDKQVAISSWGSSSSLTVLWGRSYRPPLLPGPLDTSLPLVFLSLEHKGTLGLVKDEFLPLNYFFRINSAEWGICTDHGLHLHMQLWETVFSFLYMGTSNVCVCQFYCHILGIHCWSVFSIFAKLVIIEW